MSKSIVVISAPVIESNGVQQIDESGVKYNVINGVASVTTANVALKGMGVNKTIDQVLDTTTSPIISIPKNQENLANTIVPSESDFSWFDKYKSEPNEVWKMMENIGTNSDVSDEVRKNANQVLEYKEKIEAADQNKDNTKKDELLDELKNKLEKANIPPPPPLGPSPNQQAAEAEKARLAAAEAENARIAEEAENARIAEEAENAPIAEEAENARIAEEAENARIAEEAENASIAEEAIENQTDVNTQAEQYKTKPPQPQGLSPAAQKILNESKRIHEEEMKNKEEQSRLNLQQRIAEQKASKTTPTQDELNKRVPGVNIEEEYDNQDDDALNGGKSRTRRQNLRKNKTRKSRNQKKTRKNQKKQGKKARRTFRR